MTTKWTPSSLGLPCLMAMAITLTVSSTWSERAEATFGPLGPQVDFDVTTLMSSAAFDPFSMSAQSFSAIPLPPTKTVAAPKVETLAFEQTALAPYEGMALLAADTAPALAVPMLSAVTPVVGGPSTAFNLPRGSYRMASAQLDAPSYWRDLSALPVGAVSATKQVTTDVSGATTPKLVAQTQNVMLPPSGAGAISFADGPSTTSSPPDAPRTLAKQAAAKIASAPDPEHVTLAYNLPLDPTLFTVLPAGADVMPVDVPVIGGDRRTNQVLQTFAAEDSIVLPTPTTWSLLVLGIIGVFAFKTRTPGRYEAAAA